MTDKLAGAAPARQRDDRMPGADRLPTPTEPARTAAPGRPGGVVRRLAAASLTSLTLASAVLTVAAPAAMAYGPALSCTGRTEAKVFAPWADNASYFRVSNGGFEGNGTDWALAGGATIVAGNEGWKVGGVTDGKSLKIPAGASAESRTLCVSMGEDSIRLFAYNAKVSGSILHVEAVVRNPTTGQVAQTAFDVNGDASPAGWAPTMRLGIPNLLGGTGTQELTLTFSTRGSATTWYVDDVYVDPFKSY